MFVPLTTKRGGLDLRWLTQTKKHSFLFLLLPLFVHIFLCCEYSAFLYFLHLFSFSSFTTKQDKKRLLLDLLATKMARTNLPKFGNWDEENVPYTTYFENARRVSSSDTVHSSSSPDNPNPNPVSNLETRRGSEALRARLEDKVSQEDGELQRSYESPSRLEGGRKASVSSTNHRPVGTSIGTPKRAARSNGGGFRSADHSPLHPHYQAKIGAKGSVISSPSRERKGSSEGSHGLAPSTPGRSRLRSVPRGNETPDRGASVPKFGEWDETDPSSADGFTHIFNKVKEERHGSIGNTTATRTQQSYGQKHSRSKKSKGCGCLPW